MTIPHPHTAATTSVNLWTDGDDQWAAWYRLDGELVIGRRHRATQVFGRDHDQYVVAGTPRTTLGLPVTDDEHNYPSIMVDGNGRVHVWANMHNIPMRAIRSVDPGDSDTWMSDSGWTSAVTDLPNIFDRVTYPTPMKFADGSFAFYCRTSDDGLSGQYDSYMWSRGATDTTWGSRRFIWQGLSVPDATSPGVPGAGGTSPETDRTNWSVYPTNFVVESSRDPHPGRLHVAFIWRCQGLDGNSNTWPSYAYSDDKSLTWKTVDGTSLTLPITPLNSVAARCKPACKGAWVRSITRTSNIVVAELDTDDHGFIAGDTIHCRVVDTSYDGQFTVSVVNPSGLGQNIVAWAQAAADDAAGGTGSVTGRRYVNGGALAIDHDGYPHFLMSIGPTVYIRYNGTAWVETQVSNSMGGIQFVTRFGGGFWYRGQFWALSLSSTPQTWARRARVWQITNPGKVRALSGTVGTTSGSAFEPAMDPEAWRLYSSMECLVPDGDRPLVGVYGPHGAKFQAG